MGGFIWVCVYPGRISLAPLGVGYPALGHPLSATAVKTEWQKAKGWYHDKQDMVCSDKKREAEGAVAALLRKGVPQREIMRITGKSKNFITRISKLLNK